MKNIKLVYDVGLHTGEDTAYYLAKGFNVVAFEANPVLVDSAKLRFAEYIDNQRLILVSGAICNNRDYPDGYVTFYRKSGCTELGTIQPKWVDRNSVFSGGIDEIKVPVVDFPSVIRKYGIPYYMKIDVEGVDRICISSLKEFNIRPEYLSIELERDCLKDAIRDLELLVELGYSSYAIVDQQKIPGSRLAADQCEGSVIEWQFPKSCSGSFGKDLRSRYRSFLLTKANVIVRHLLQKMFGANSLLRKFKVGRFNVGAEFIQVAERIFRVSLPGWHDVHAKHASVQSHK